jgi:predicted dehydrogenase
VRGRGLRTVLFGFGMMGSGFSRDRLMGKYFKYATHGQVLRDHPRFSWEAVVDPSREACALAKRQWCVAAAVGNLGELPDRLEVEVAVIATPPGQRLEIVERLKGLKAVMVEKPLGETYEESQAFLESCRRKGIAVQVNFWRRGDAQFQRLARSKLRDHIGRPLAAFGIYGNGLKNNGCHMIDFTRMLLGEVTGARVIAPELGFEEGPLPRDRNVSFALEMEEGFSVLFHAIPFGSYREIGLDIWGETGRLSLLQESLGISLFPRTKNRAITGEWEIASDRPRILKPTCGRALYRLYDNLAAHLLRGDPLWSPGEEALRTEKVVQDLMASF